MRWWLWGTTTSPPVECDCAEPGCNVRLVRSHRSYGLLVGRVFVGVTRSVPLDDWDARAMLREWRLAVPAAATEDLLRAMLGLPERKR